MSTVVVPEAEHGTEIFDRLQSLRREEPVEDVHLLLEGLCYRSM